MKICLYVGTALPKIGGAEMVVHHLMLERIDSRFELDRMAPNGYHGTTGGETNGSSPPGRMYRSEWIID